MPADTTPQHGLARWLPQRRRVLVTDRVDLSPTARTFLHASIRRDRYRRRRATTVLSVLLVLAVAAAGIAVDQQRRAKQRRLATEILLTIDALGAQPRPPGVIALQGLRGAYRIRMGDHRVIYTVDDGRLVVLVIDLGHRREIYRDL